MISCEELDRIKKLSADYYKPLHSREGWQTEKHYANLMEQVWSNLPGLLEAADRGVLRPNDILQRLERLEAAHIENAQKY